MSKEKEWEENQGQVFWTPLENEELKGTVREIVEGAYGFQYIIETAEGILFRTPSHKVLQNRMTDVKVGEEVKITYTGEEPPRIKGQNPTRIYKVFKRKA